jgi:hypothetical protein
MSSSAVIGHRLLHQREHVKAHKEDNKAENDNAEAEDVKPME